LRIAVIIAAILLGFLGALLLDVLIGIPILLFSFGLFFYGLLAKEKDARSSRQSDAATSRRFCISCGVELHDESEFCHKCGAKQPEQVEYAVRVPLKSAKFQISRHNSRLTVVGVVVIIIVAVWAAYSFTQPSPTPTTYTSTNLQSGAPDFTLPIVGSNGPTGQTATLSAFRGKVVLLEFIEPWSPHCQHMAPILDNLYAQYGSNVVFISISGPWNGATANDTAYFIRIYGTTWTFLYDSSGIVFSNYGVQSVPTFYIIGKDGSVSWERTGEQTSVILTNALLAAVSS
jgi:thiol-disulfide isomerase/thioredoxin